MDEVYNSISSIYEYLIEIDYCLVLLEVSKDFGMVQIFCVRAKIDLHIVQVPNFVHDQKMNSIQ